MSEWNLSGSRLLLVDDTPENLDVLCVLLEAEGYDLALAPDGPIALQIARRTRPDLILLDIVMPGMDGYEVCRQLKADPELCEVPIIFITAKGQTEDIVEGFRRGGVDYIAKPFRDEEVLARVKTHLHLHLLRRELGEKNERLQRQNHELEAANRQIQSERDEVQRVLGVLQRTQSQLVLSEKMAAMGQLVAGIVHELNTPVGAIGSAGDTLSRATLKLQQSLAANAPSGNRTVDAALKTLDNVARIVASGTQRVSDIVAGLCNFARLDQATYQSADLNEGLDSTLELLQPRLHARIELLKDYAPLPTIYCAPAQLNQVFMHLLSNAIDAVADGGQIRVRTFAEDEGVGVCVSDSGNGMDPAELERIFDVGFSESDTRVHLDFRLAIAYFIVQEHQGTIDIDSQIGQGTTVSLRLPQRPNDRQPGET